MKSKISCFLVFIFQFCAYAQVGIGTVSPSNNAILELSSNDKGFLMPRLTTSQRLAMTPSAILDKGLEVFDTDLNSIWYWNGSAWTKVSDKNIFDSDGDISPSVVTNRMVNFTNGGSLNFDSGTMFIDATNNRLGVGGITAPLNKLHIGTSFRVGSSGNGYLIGNEGTASQAGYLGFHRANGTRNGYIGWDNSNMYYNAENSANHLFYGGRIGVLTSTPLGRLHVTQSAGDVTNLLVAEINNCGSACAQGTSRNLILSNTDTTNSSFATIAFVPSTTSTNPSGAEIVGIDRDATNNYAGIDFMTRNASGFASRLTIKSSGNIGIGINTPTNPLQLASGAFVTTGGVWTNASDIRLKSNIKPLQYGLAEVLKLNPVQYTMNIDHSKQIGLIAQEVNKVVPEVVSGIEGDLSKGETLGISYGNLVPVLINAIKEQQLEIEKIKNEIKTLSEMKKSK